MTMDWTKNHFELEKEYRLERMKEATIVCLKAAALTILVVLIIFLLTRPANAEEWSDDQIVSAIWHAEGGAKTKYPYGIRSVHCEGKSECRQVCKNTVKNNRKRFAQYGSREYPDFISFLASRYCPTKGSNLSKAEKALNGNWYKNVMFFLRKGNSHERLARP